MPNKAALDLIKSFEGCRLTAYQDSVGVWTIGYGHTKGVKSGDTITQAQADQMFADEIVEYEDEVKKLLVGAVNENQLGALTSFCYNLGAGNLKKSTLLRKVNAGDFAGAASQFLLWNKAGGKVLKGLTRRREAEKKLFETPA